MSLIRNLRFQYFIAFISAVFAGFANSKMLICTASVISNNFVLLFKWCSLPMIALSILSTTSHLTNNQELFLLGKKVLKYTLLTTILAASIALSLFLLINPSNLSIYQLSFTFSSSFKSDQGLFGILLLTTVVSTLVISSIILNCRVQLRLRLERHFILCYQGFVAIIQKLLKFMPIAIWAFITLFIREVDGLAIKSLLSYLLCILLANIIQATVLLPMLLKFKNISALSLLKAMWPALIIAFWSKSSSVALPVAIQCATEKARISQKIAQFSLPLCTTINMNACAAFILITVLFVSTSYGVTFSPIALIGFIVIATIAAIGNAGVPMGCFTLSMALLAYLNVPLQAMGLILPFYVFIDMVESAINVWSDICVTAVVEEEIQSFKKKTTTI